MSINPSNDDDVPTDAEERDEEVACQEEVYLEETEEEVRAILVADDHASAQTAAEYWRRKIEEIEVDWEGEIFHDQDKQ